jgi:CheY-like chemotaxis protein
MRETGSSERRDGEYRILHIAAGSEIRQTLANYLQETADISVRSASDGPEALAMFDESVDCIVTDLPVSGLSWTALDDAVPSDVPTILFTDRDPTVIPEGILASADSLVERGSDKHLEFRPEDTQCSDRPTHGTAKAAHRRRIAGYRATKRDGDVSGQGQWRNCLGK